VYCNKLILYSFSLQKVSLLWLNDLLPYSGIAEDCLVQAFHQCPIVTMGGHIGSNLHSDGQAVEQAELINQI
jgi:hypothetical protein